MSNSNTYNHAHCLSTIDSVHENIELVKTINLSISMIASQTLIRLGSYQMIGDDILCHNDNNKLICENDFSPPESDLESF